MNILGSNPGNSVTWISCHFVYQNEYNLYLLLVYYNILRGSDVLMLTRCIHLIIFVYLMMVMIWDKRRSINQSIVCICLFEFKRILWFEFDRKLYDFVPLKRILIIFFHSNIQNTSLKQINLYFVYFVIKRFIIYKLFKIVIFNIWIKVLFIVSCISIAVHR